MKKKGYKEKKNIFPFYFRFSQISISISCNMGFFIKENSASKRKIDCNSHSIQGVYQVMYSIPECEIRVPDAVSRPFLCAIDEIPALKSAAGWHVAAAELLIANV